MAITLYYVHDPMCSWCWAFQTALKNLLHNLPDHIHVIRLLGGLAPDSDVPMPEETRDYVMDNWKRIQQQVPGTRFNYDFWTNCKPRRSTYPACRAVIAARLQDEKYDSRMTLAIQQAYYLQARNPSDYPTLIELANETGLDTDRFENDIKSIHVDETLRKEIKSTRRLNLNSFPGLLLDNEDKQSRIEIDYNNPDKMLDQIESNIS